MSGRIALVVKGLPPVPLEEAIKRFGQYYKRPASGVFHSSQSFPKGESSGGIISFVNAEGGYSGGGGLTKQSIGDLRQLQKDFLSFVEQNPSIYTNSPTSESRAKLYRRIGFKGDQSWQVLDARRVSEKDSPYVQALDTAMLSPREREVIGIPNTNAFFKLEDGTIRTAKRFGVFELSGLFSGKMVRPDMMLNQMNKRAMEIRDAKRSGANWEDILRERQQAQVEALRRPQASRERPQASSQPLSTPTSLERPTTPRRSSTPRREAPEMDFRTFEEMRLGLPPVGIEEYRRRRSAGLQ